MPAMIMRNANGHCCHTETITSAQKALSPMSQNGHLVHEVQDVDEQFVQQAGVTLEDELPGDDARVGGDRVGDQEERPKRPASAELFCSTIDAAMPKSHENPTVRMVKHAG